MSQQIQITGGAKVRNLQDVIIGTSGVLSSVAFDVANGVPRLDVNGKILVSQLPNSVMEYKGTWSAATNTPTLVNGTGNQGDVYLCNVAGTVDFGAGPIAFFVGDQVIYSGSIWQRASGATGTVTSVAVTESGDSLNITGSPITTSGTINIGFNGTNLQYVNGAGNLTTFPDLTGYVPYTGATANVDLGTFNLTADVITGATGSFASNGGSDTFAINHSSGAGIALNITKGGSGEGLYINKTSGSGNAATIIGTLNATTLVKSGGTSSQYLMADGSVSTLTNPITGTGTTNTLPKFTAASTIGNSNITDTGSLITLGSNSYVNGNIGIGIAAPLAPLQLGNGYTDIEYDGFRNTGSPSFLMAYGQTSIIHRILGGAYSQASTINLDLSLAISKNKGTASGFRITSGVGTGVGTSNNFLSFSSLIGAADETFTATEYMRLDANGALGIGTTSLTGYSLRVSKNITGATTSSGIQSDGVIQSDVTTSTSYNATLASTAATTFTIGTITHYIANQGTFGVGSTVTNQFGFQASSNLIGATNNYGFRGAIPSGTNRWNIYMDGTANNYMAGSLGIGSTGLTNITLRLGKTITGSTTSYAIYNAGVVQSDVTGAAWNNISELNTAASAFTLANFYHYGATQGTIGAGSTITTQRGFFANSNLTGATINYGFQGSIPSGTNRWNIYMDGTAANYMAGQTGVGTTTLGSYIFNVGGSVATLVNFNSTNASGFYTTYSASGVEKAYIGLGANTISGLAISDFGIVGSANIVIASGSGGTETMRIDSTKRIGIGTGASINASAKVQIDSTTSGFLLPRMTATQRAAIASPAEGLIVVQTDGTQGLYLYIGAAWHAITML